MRIISKQQEKIVLGLLLKNGVVDNFYCINKESRQDLELISIILEIKAMQ